MKTLANVDPLLKTYDWGFNKSLIYELNHLVTIYGIL